MKKYLIVRTSGILSDYGEDCLIDRLNDGYIIVSACSISAGSYGYIEYVLRKDVE